MSKKSKRRGENLSEVVKSSCLRVDTFNLVQDFENLLPTPAVERVEANMWQLVYAAVVPTAWAVQSSISSLVSKYK